MRWILFSTACENYKVRLFDIIFAGQPRENNIKKWQVNCTQADGGRPTTNLVYDNYVCSTMMLRYVYMALPSYASRELSKTEITWRQLEIFIPKKNEVNFKRRHLPLLPHTRYALDPFYANSYVRDELHSGWKLNTASLIDPYFAKKNICSQQISHNAIII